MTQTPLLPLAGYLGRSREETLRDLRKAGIQVEAIDTAVPGPLAVLHRLAGAPVVQAGATVRALVAGGRVIGFATAEPGMVREGLADVSTRLEELKARVDALEEGGGRRTGRTRKSEKT
jgi:hypothetical protein